MKNYFKRIVALGITCALSVGTAAPAAMADETQTSSSVTVTATATDGTQFLSNEREMSVSSDEAESFGFEDSVTDGVSALDALVKMHEEKYGEEFTKETAANYLSVSSSGWITKAFEKTDSCGFCVDCDSVLTYINQTKLSDNSVFEFYFYTDTTYYGDVYKHIDDITTFEDTDTVIETGLAGAGAAYVGNDGALTAIENVNADENGKMTLKFDESGTYYITLTGTVKETVTTDWSTGAKEEKDCPIIPSVTKVTVKKLCTETVFATAAAADALSFLVNNYALDVSSDEAESFGFEDSVTDGVSLIDALVKMHEEKYGEEFTKETATNYFDIEATYKYIIKAFGVETSAVGYLRNGSFPDSLFEKIESGDRFEFYFYTDTTYYGDVYKHIDDITTFEDTDTVIETGLAGAGAAYVGNDGALTAIENVNADENGKMTLKFDESGTYYITLTGTVKETVTTDWSTGAKEEKDCQIIPSVTKITVLNFSEDVMKKTAQTIAAKELSYGSEWYAMELARSGYAVDDEYYESVKENISTAVNKATDAERTIIALTAIGKYVPEELINAISSKTLVTNGGLMASIYGLIALDTKDYEIKAADDAETITRDDLIANILSHQTSDGGFAFSEQFGADIDTTAMALQALSNYTDKENVNKAVNNALIYIKENVTDETNANSLAQVVTAYAALDMDASAYIEKMLSFYDGNGNFKYNGEANDYATQQAYYALVACYRQVVGMNSLYDMSDVYYEIESVADGDNNQSTCVIYAPFQDNAELICISYDESGMPSVTSVSAELKMGDDNKITVPKSSKIMLWSSLESMLPLCGIYNGAEE